MNTSPLPMSRTLKLPGPSKVSTQTARSVKLTDPTLSSPQPIITTAPSNPIIDVLNTGLYMFIFIRSMALKNVTDPIGVGLVELQYSNRDSDCAPGETRTPNRLIRSQMLYPLSYGRLDIETIGVSGRVNAPRRIRAPDDGPATRSSPRP